MIMSSCIMLPDSPVGSSVYLIGAGGFADELLDWIYLDFPSFQFSGCIVTEKKGLSKESLQLPCGAHLPIDILDPARDYGGSFFLLAVASPPDKKRLVEQLGGLNFSPISFISSSAYVSPRARLGSGVVICPGSSLSPFSSVGDFVTLNCNSLLGHHSQVHDFCTMYGQNSLNGNAVMEDSSLLFSCSCIAPGVLVGARSMVGIGSVVVKNVAPDTVVFGNPAKKIF